MADRQLTAIGELHIAFTAAGLDHWLFGGWAVDFHVGAVTRVHADIDLAIRSAPAMAADADAVLMRTGWAVAAGGHGYRTYRKDGELSLDLALVEDGDEGWPVGSFGSHVAVLEGRAARVIGRAALVIDKSAALGDPAKDTADLARLLGGVRG
jgi:hypothetical protein